MNAFVNFVLHLLYPALAVGLGSFSLWYARRQDKALKTEIHKIQDEIRVEKAEQMRREKANGHEL